jgi:Ecdysteroid kinase-like family
MMDLKSGIMEPLPLVAAVERLTVALRGAGVLPHGRVHSVEVMGSTKNLRSHTFRLRLRYEGSAAGAPDTIILKMGHLDDAGRPSYANRSEIAFYREVAPALPRQLVPGCFEVIAAEDATTWHLLLEDLTDSHFIVTEWPRPPATEQCESIVQSLARFHSAWWDDPRLGVTVGSWRDASGFEKILQGFARQFASFTEKYGELMSSGRRDLYHRLLDGAPRLLARYYSHRNLTITHWYNNLERIMLAVDDLGCRELLD